MQQAIERYAVAYVPSHVCGITYNIATKIYDDHIVLQWNRVQSSPRLASHKLLFAMNQKLDSQRTLKKMSGKNIEH